MTTPRLIPPYPPPVPPWTPPDAPVAGLDPHTARASAWLTCLEAVQHERSLRLAYCLIGKRWLDLIAALLLLIILSPLLLLIAVAIRLESGGPVLFRQPRIGRFGHPFRMYKFRTMIPDRRQTPGPFDGAERRLAHKTRHDPRVTRLGKLLRATSLDELPQFVNILRGEMSFIGPRPELVAIVARYAPWQHQRHLVRPGLSGWWQIHGRSDRPMHEHTELDLHYVVHHSFQLDLYIVLRTFRALLSRAGAF